MAASPQKNIHPTILTEYSSDYPHRIYALLDKFTPNNYRLTYNCTSGSCIMFYTI